MSEATFPQTSMEEPAPRLHRRRPLLRRFLILMVALGLGIPSGFLVARLIRIPLVDTLDTYRPDVITRLFTRDGDLLAEYSIQRRILVRKKDMAPAVVDAIVATEDASFFRHSGVDPFAIVRALSANVMAGRKVEGASTLTQQLAKQLFLTPEKSWRRKLNEAFLAFEIEKDLTKDQIFEMYANQVYLGEGAYGVEAASRVYFGKHAKDLTIPEAAVLAGINRRPEYYSPIRHPDNALRRRNHVLRRMLEVKSITRDQYQQAVNTPLVLGSYKEDAPAVGAYFSEEVRQYLEKHYGTEGLYRSGLEVTTTLDLKVQRAAEDALRRGLQHFDHRRGFRKPVRNVITEGLSPEAWSDPSWKDELIDGRLYPAVVLDSQSKTITIRFRSQTIGLPPSAWAWTGKSSLQGLLKRGDLVHLRRDIDPKSKKAVWYLDQVPQVQGAVVVIDARTGEVRAMVGGYDFHESKFNRAVQSLRQVGSAFKAFVYGAAMEKGMTMADTVIDAPFTMQFGTTVYSPRNYEGDYEGVITIQRALEKSINIPAVKTIMRVGISNVVDFARHLGVTAPLPAYPSLALGSAGVSPMELTAAFNVFPNQGVYIRPRLIRKIKDATQKVLEENYADLSEGTSAQTAYTMAWALQATIDRGTAYDAHTLPGTLAGKTGTTNGFTDAWFVGFSPEYSIGVWVGYDDPSRSLGGGSTGAIVALPIWTDIVKKMYELKLMSEKKEFEQPAGVVRVPMDLYSGRRGPDGCGRVVEEAFVAGTEPDRMCTGELVSISKVPPQMQRDVAPAGESVVPVTAVETSSTAFPSPVPPAPRSSALPLPTTSPPPSL